MPVLMSRAALLCPAASTNACELRTTPASNSASPMAVPVAPRCTSTSTLCGSSEAQPALS
ncbi:MAG: hypothetical protein AUG49_05785 [Catenulispora sp. 13_1_20CM_3_70_7]|nr:MAG: hypothetical protein AUG49_05785 [Catenulispora sp. 13_1_20CM_3_70_7]